MKNLIRRALIFWYLDAKGFGLEIGPSFNPIAPKRAGYNVKILDHLSSNGLRKKYAEHAVDLSKVEEVDYVWSGQPYTELIGQNHIFDWIIASHVIEHTPCLISFLINCDEVLKEDGILSLVIPDKRRCFDELREKSGLGTIIDAYHNDRRASSAGTAAEYFLTVARKNMPLIGRLGFVHKLEDAQQAITDIREHGAYLDLHNWVFTPSSFRMIIEDLYQLGYTRLREVGWFSTIRGEFFIALGRRGRGYRKSRMALAKTNRRET